MRRSIQIKTTLICFALSGAWAQAALYWDGNGTTDGAGATPNGIWGIDAFWNATADGTTTSPAAWVPGEDAIFSAGADGTGAFTVGIAGTQTAGNLTVEEGTITISGGTALNVGGAVAGKGIIDIAAGLTTTVSTVLTGGDDTGQITKSGDGTLIVNASCTYTGLTTIASGTLTLGAANLLNASSDLSISNVGSFDMNHFDQTIDGLYGAGEVINGGTLTVGQNNEVAASFSGTIGSYFDYSPITLIKVGTGKQSLGGTSYYSGPTIVAGGVLAITDGDALGTYESPTIVSNGAALQLASGTLIASEHVILSGTGVTNSGALYGTSGSPRWAGGAELDADTRINWDGGGTWPWQGPTYNIDGTYGGSNFNLTIGGHGGTIRLNMANPDNTAVNLGTGKFIKDGTCILQLEDKTVCSGFYFNGGAIYPRNISTIGQGSIYAGTNSCGFYALFQSCSIATPISLAAGANLWFDARNYQGSILTFTYTGVMSGSGGVSVRDAGRTIFTRANTYTGTTTIQSNSVDGTVAGTLVLGATGSIAQSAVIDVQTGATFDVSALSGGFIVGAAQTLQGNGTVVGDLAVNGTVSPGDSIGNLTLNNNLTLATGARLSVEVDKSASPSCDLITVLGTLTSAGAGAVTVANLGPALVPGDSFQILSQPLLNGQALTVASADGRVVWTNRLAADGSIAVVSVSPPPVTQVPRLTSITVGGPVSVRVTWTNVVVGSNYWLQSTTNLKPSDWTDLSPVTAWGTTASQVDGVPVVAQPRYYRVRCLAPGGAPPSALPRITSVVKGVATTLTLSYTNTVAGINYVVQYKTNLTTMNWTSLSPVTAGGTTSSTTDTVSAGPSQRFYRVFGQF